VGGADVYQLFYGEFPAFLYNVFRPDNINLIDFLAPVGNNRHKTGDMQNDYFAMHVKKMLQRIGIKQIPGYHLRFRRNILCRRIPFQNKSSHLFPLINKRFGYIDPQKTRRSGYQIDRFLLMSVTLFFVTHSPASLKPIADGYFEIPAMKQL
jgi:hypothetical protein